MTLEELLAELEASPVERLRWRVLCRFGVLPASARARELSDADCIICGAHMVLDGRATDGRGYGEGAVNVSFDEDRFRRLNGGEHE